MNDLVNLMVFLAHSGVEFSLYTDPVCIDEDSIKDGAVMCVSVRNAAHMNFDRDGNLIGSSTDVVKTHKKKKK